ncbi:twitchin-like [Diadema setosum]|uniref:twitchin-like n=1 Tax=Diadema setosum TaxID=31175 RepID=UPI003B3AFBDC
MFRVRAFNKYGDSEPLETEGAVEIKSEYDKPEAPGVPKLSSVTDDSITVSWQPPRSDGGAEIFNYVLEIKETRGTRWLRATRKQIKTPNFRVSRLTKGREYEFRVAAENEAGLGAFSKTSAPIVAKAPIETAEFIEPLKDTSATAGKTVTLECRISNPRAEVKWIKDGAQLYEYDRVTIIKEGQRRAITVRNVGDRDTGQYSCECGRAATSCWVSVTAPPKIDMRAYKDVITVKSGNVLRVLVPYSGCPAPKVEWHRHDTRVAEDSRTQIETRESRTHLVIRNCKRGDTGQYTITVSNEAGRESAVIRVNVVDVPGPPMGPLDIADVGRHSVCLSWQPPKDDGGSKVQSYTVEQRQANRRNWTSVSNYVTQTTFTVSGLSEKIEYEFRVCAENINGVGPPLHGIEPVVIVAPYSVPTRPGKPEISNVQQDRMTLTWSEPSHDGGKPIKGYIIERRENFSVHWLRINKDPIPDTTFTITDLTEGHNYEFRVSAVNDTGIGNPSEVSAPPRLARAPARRPAPPGTPGISDITATSVRLSWTQPSSDGGSQITHYTVERRAKGSYDWTDRMTIHDTSCSIDDLKEDHEYQFRVRAVNAAGMESDPSKASESFVAMPQQAPAAPAFLVEPHNAMVSEGDQVTFSCRISGWPAPKLLWMHQGRELHTGRKYNIVSEEGTHRLTVTSATEHETGMYTVIAKNKHGMARSSAELLIHRPPQLTLDRHLHELSVRAGHDIHIPVTLAYGTPKPTFVWKRHDGEVLDTRGRYSMKERAVVHDYDLPTVEPYSGFFSLGTELLLRDPDIATTYSNNSPLSLKPRRIPRVNVVGGIAELYIKEAEREDSGVYTLVAENRLGSHSISARVNVMDKPGPPQGPINIESITKNSASFSWTPPHDDGGSPIQRYHVQIRESGRTTWQPLGTSLLPNFMAKNLKENTHYVIRVTAENQYGVSAPLDIREAIMVKRPFDTPSSPGSPKVSNIQKDSVHLTWTAPASDGGSPITGYVIERRDTTSRRWIQANHEPLTTTSHTVINLREDSEYEFRVLAENQMGASEPSAVSARVLVRDPKDTVPPKFVTEPNDLFVAQGKTAMITCHVSGYPVPEVRWYRLGREILHGRKFHLGGDGNVHTLTVNEVYPEDAGDIAVTATNKGGTITATVFLNVHVLPKFSLPARLRAPMHCLLGEYLVLKVPFTGAPRPEIKWDRDGVDVEDGGRFEIKTTAHDTTLIIKGLTKEDAGKYTVVGSNELGHDTCSVTLNILRHPDPPRNLEMLEVTSDTVRLSWQPPHYDGGSTITTYMVEKREVGLTTWARCISTKNTHHTVINLRPDTQYQFRIIAFNSYGPSEPCQASAVVCTKSWRKTRPQFEDYEAKRRFYDSLVDDYDSRPPDFMKRPGSIYDYYQILEELGRGAYGVVYRAIEKATGKTWAAKFMRCYGSERDLVKREIEIMKMLHHRRLLNLHEVFETDEEIIMILEFLSGGELFDRLVDENHVLTEPEVVHYMRQICEGMKHMHDRHIVHLDLKPENVMLRTRTSDDIKVIDFGLARQLDPDNPIKVMFGTPEFVAPEVVNHEPVGLPSDMWALGCMAYIMLSGISPFMGDTDKESLQLAAIGEWDFDEEAFADISDEGLDWIERILIKEKEYVLWRHAVID